MSYSNLDSYATVSMDNIETLYNIDFDNNQIYKMTNKEDQRIALFENSVTSGVLKAMNDIRFEIVKDTDSSTNNDIYKITFLIDNIGQEYVELNSELSAFRIPLLLSIPIKNSEVSFKTFADITFTNSLGDVFTNPSENGFKIKFSTTKIRDSASSVASVFMIHTTYVSPPIYISTNDNSFNFKVIQKSNGSLADINGKLIYNIIRCI
jgi:hypothetical protein